MTVWLAGGLLLGAVFWFGFLLLQRRYAASPGQFWAAAPHVAWAGLLSVAPWRSLLDPGYIGYGLGLLRFQGRSASLPATLILASLLGSAWTLLRFRGGRTYALPAVVSVLFAVNLCGGLLREEAPQFQLGEHLTLTGTPAQVLVFLLLVLPFTLVAAFAVRRLRAR